MSSQRSGQALPADQAAQAEAPPPPSDGIQPEPTATTTPDPKPANPRVTTLTARQATLTQTLADLKAQRLHLATQTKLPSGLPLPTTTASGDSLPEDEVLAAALKSSNAVIKEHIAWLHKYNEIKDIGQGLMGLIADKRDCRVVGVMEEFGVGEKD